MNKNKLVFSAVLIASFMLFEKNSFCENGLSVDNSIVSSLSYFQLGTTTLDKLLLDLKNSNKAYRLKTEDVHFKIMHIYKDYLDAPYTISLIFEDSIYNNPAKFKLFFTPKSKLLYRVEIETDGDKNKFLDFFKERYGSYSAYSDACYDWESKPDGAGEVFYNILFCPTGAYSPKITLFWTDWDYLYPKALLEAFEDKR